MSNDKWTRANVAYFRSIYIIRVAVYIQQSLVEYVGRIVDY